MASYDSRDPSGLVTKKHEQIRRPDNSWADYYFVYGYDSAARLETETIHTSSYVGPMHYARVFTYDMVGNRLTMAVTGGPTTTYSYHHEGTGTDDYRLDHISDGVSTTSYSYHPGGALATEVTGGVTLGYGYDTDGHLNSVTNNGLPASRYALSWDGRRMRRAAGSAETDYLYDGWNAIGEFGVGAEVTYLSGLGLDDWILKNQDGSKTYFSHLGDIGSVQQTLGPNGTVAVLTAHSYKAFGEFLDPPAGTPSARGFTGRSPDVESGHLDFRNRVYDPELGRFTSQDPIVDVLSGAYVYANNSPISYFDPTGLLTVPVIGWIDVGENAGRNSLNYYSDVLADPSSNIWQKIGASAGGFFSALWTPETSDKTFLTLSTAVALDVACRAARVPVPQPPTAPPPESTPRGRPKPTPKWVPPTNPPQPPPKEVPPGWRVREMPPTEQYPDGYWKLEKPMPNGGWQPIDPSTMKPGTRPQTHIPFPPGWKG